jgi:DNA polymerase-3 subunit gamma/tau
LSYLVFARKYRPTSFDEVSGQHAVITTLRNAIAGGRIAHAFLFAGPRGVGKTTTARLLARALNCEKGPTAEPCGTCSSCTEIALGHALDVIEIDGASNRGIDDVKSLRESIQYNPARDRHKVVIIDEVHMLTPPAFNALLKTLEEPPAHVKFIFATTELHKVPATILSRCQVHEFRRISFAETMAKLREIVSREGLDADDAALALVARQSDGCLRDAESALDQVVAFGGGKLNEENVRTALGLIGNDVLFEATAAVLAGDGARLFALVDRLVDGGTDLRQFIARLAEHVRNLLVVKVAAAAEPLIASTASDFVRLQEQAPGLSEEEALRLLNLLALSEEELKRTSAPRFTVERTLMKLLHARRLTPLPELIAAIGSGAPLKPSPPLAPLAPASARREPVAVPVRPPPVAPAPAPASAPAPARALPPPAPAPSAAPTPPSAGAPTPAAAPPAPPPGSAKKDAARKRAAEDPSVKKLQDLFKASLVDADEPN